MSASPTPAAEPAPADLPRWVSTVLRWRYLILAAASLAWLAAGYSSGGGDWLGFIRPASMALVGRGEGPVAGPPLSLYANAPSIQVGPVAVAFDVPFALLGARAGLIVVMAAMSLALPLCVWILERTARRTGRAPHLDERVLVGGLLVSALWADLAVRYAHLDDVLALLAGALALHAAAGRHPWQTGLWVGVAAASKPWAIGFLALAVIFGRRGAWRAVAGASVVTALAWLPFVLGDASTLARLSSYRIHVEADSVLRAVGVGSDLLPTWVRPTQVIVALILGAAAALAGRWAAVPMVTIASRIVLDGATYPYYFAGLAVAALAWDLIGSRRRMPWWTIAVVLFEYDLRWLTTDARLMAGLHLLVCLAILGLALPTLRLSRYRRAATAVSASS